MDDDEKRQIATRIAIARRESGLTQRALADLLGVSTRSIQNYESGAVVPYRHFRQIEVVTRKRPGWLLEGRDENPLASSLSALHAAMEQHRSLMNDHLTVMRQHTERLREQREAQERRRSRHRE